MYRALLIGLVLAAPVWAAPFSLDSYRLAGRYDLPAGPAAEASAVTYNWDSDTVFVLGDEGDALVEVNKTGSLVSMMTLTGFDDTEGLTYIGNGRFVVVEERLQSVYLLTYVPDGTAVRSALPAVALGPTIGNIGLEGISYSQSTGNYYLVKEKTPQRVIEASIDFTTCSATVNDLFIPSLGVSDLSDVQVLSAYPNLIGGPDQNSLLIYSQESARLLQVSPSGTVLSSFDFSLLAGDAEGVTIDRAGTIYVVGEKPEMFVLTAVPEPASLALIAGGVVMLLRRPGRRA